MKVIFIHGINQQNLDAHRFKQHWKNVFSLGLNKNNLTLESAQTTLEFPFYGDILTEYNLKNAINLDTMRPHWHFLDRLKHLHQHKTPNTSLRILPHYQYNTKMTLREKLFQFSQITKDRALKEMVILLNHFPNLHESLVEKFIAEAYLYWYQATFKQAIHQRIKTCFEPGQKHIVVAHSLGTVIAYNLLHELSSEYHVERFITLASPLPFNVVQKHIQQPMSRPRVLQGDWYNFYSKDDYLTTFPMSPPLFDFEPQIHNRLITTFVDKPHEIIGYLQHPSIIRCIFEHTSALKANQHVF
ncbi:hypothetical protein [Acinetobacter boissieri]|uniref:PGAP1-like protein n=1 Tax=Acinetobacter boissieri TaxID=1219383 RepID=A0A1G6HF37_9GAMM|nr:hypothetical protein [Acinetobacter boissieri]SDB92763.1 hypothetical protein SAMN05421733_105116 [Acinetobacter boissieri]